MPMEVDIETIIADYVARHVKTEEEGEPEAEVSTITLRRASVCGPN